MLIRNYTIAKYTVLPCSYLSSYTACMGLCESHWNGDCQTSSLKSHSSYSLTQYNTCIHLSTPQPYRGLLSQINTDMQNKQQTRCLWQKPTLRNWNHDVEVLDQQLHGKNNCDATNKNLNHFSVYSVNRHTCNYLSKLVSRTTTLFVLMLLCKIHCQIHLSVAV